MIVRNAYELPEDKKPLRRRAIVLEWVTILLVAINILVLYLVLGNSQAMRTAWFEDILALIPPISFLLATHFETKRPNEKHPYGFFRSVDIGYLTGSMALFVFGFYLLYESARKLIEGKHPTIGTMVVFDHQIWLGWLMIAALVYTAIPPVVVGLLKRPVASKLHDKALYADADMNKADWLTGLSGVVGVLGIGLGYWWLDAVAAMVISADIAWDGIRNLKRVGDDLLDAVPREVESGRQDPLLDRVKQTLDSMDWLTECDVRMREEGHVFSGEAIVVPKSFDRGRDLIDCLEKARREILTLDWRLYDFSIVPSSPHREGGQGPKG